MSFAYLVNPMRYLLLSIGLLLAQKTFEGTLVMETRFEGEMAKQMADMLRESLPAKIVMQYLGQRSRIDMGEAILITDLSTRKMYILNPATQTYREQAIPDSAQNQSSKVKIQKTKEKTKILGYSAEKYQAESQTEQGLVKIEVWTTGELPPPATDRGQGSILAQGVQAPGFPLKIVSHVPNIDLKIAFVATQVKQEKLSEDLFRVPAGYVKEEASDAD